MMPVSDKQILTLMPNKSTDEPTMYNNSKIRYTRDFLLSFWELDSCKRLPTGIDPLILSECQEITQNVPEWRRAPAPISWADNSSGYSRGSLDRSSRQASGSGLSQGRWESRSGLSDRDASQQMDRDSSTQDSGRRFGGQTRNPLQHSEHDGLLGSGAFPRQSGHMGALNSKARGNGGQNLSRSTEPYQPPRPYKASVQLRRDTFDLCNDETFGSIECTSKDRAEEEKMRRASFESMRKEQQKALQEKQKDMSNKIKEHNLTDIDSLVAKPNDVNCLHSNEPQRSEDHVGPVAPFDHSKSLHAAASRPLVPPGFASNIMDKNQGSRVSKALPTPQLPIPSREANTESMVNGLNAIDKLMINGTEVNYKAPEPSSTSLEMNKQPDDSEMHMDGALMTSRVSNVSDSRIVSDILSDKPNQEKLSEDLINNDGTFLAVENGSLLANTQVVPPQNPASILEKLFGNSLTINDKDSGFIEPNVSSDENTWRSQQSPISKFSQWFLQDEKIPDDTSSSKSTDLLSLFVNNEKGVSSLIPLTSQESAVENVPSVLPLEKIENASAVAPFANLHINDSPLELLKPDIPPRVLTCEDLEQSILAEVKETNSDITFDLRPEQKPADVDNTASQHLLSLLHKGMGQGLPPDPEMGSSKTLVSEMQSPSGIGVESDRSSEKTLTLETLFGTAFMKELHSVEAPVSLQRSLGGGVPPFPIKDDGFGHTLIGEPGSSSPVALHTQERKPDKIHGNWVDVSEIEGSKGLNIGIGEIQLPEEESLITLTEPERIETFKNISKAGPLVNSINHDLFLSVGDEMASLDALLKGQHMRVGVNNFGEGIDHHPFREILGGGGPHIPAQSEPPYHHQHLLGMQQSSPQLLHYQRQQQSMPLPPDFHLNMMQQQRRQMDQHQHHHRGGHGPELFLPPPNMLHDPFHAGGGPRFDHPMHHHQQRHHHHLMQQQVMQNNFHQTPVQGIPPLHLGGTPFNHMGGFLPEGPLMQGFPIHHRSPPNHGTHGMSIPGAGVNHPEALERLIEMEMRVNSSKNMHVNQNPGLYGPTELDLGFGLG
ncbi:uncharacterized protein LOC18424436 isoform X2 [Amborella trichopoda]|uniref:uncharacterized protein LOC18424436 isoform X2 n=1 Tax=Amborella trichopoda TaxID=13333 RepID=UPI0005D34FEA|nr:uncharacterized protein LOC18424436 isoform X2 [Amborella trichopoda]|eukprot:XP_011628999.1 uncharacterized protein LOC18424436 isoform X2 [Amborella trichopoda]